MNTLYYGDNLDVLPRIAADSVDLVYLDPPFKSNANYNVLFKSHKGDEASAQIHAFEDTWHWGPQAEDAYQSLTTGPASVEVATFVQAMRKILGTSDMMSYLVMMAPRLVEMRRVLKSTGSIFLHCDQTASHYLKLLMDAVFGPDQMRNEIIWFYPFAGRSRTTFSRKHDTIFWYSKTKDYVFNGDSPDVRIPISDKSVIHNYRYTDEDGRKYREDPRKSGKTYRYYLDEGKIPEDVWTDIDSLHFELPERLGYPTQKPLKLLERIIAACSSPGDLVLDPFCGCGTAVDAAQKMDRRWIGIDITYIAVDLIIKRLRHRYGKEILTTFTTDGIPQDIEGAAALFDRNPFDFERWAVSMVNGQPNDKQVGDQGVDGRIRFDAGADDTGIAIVSVKGGHQLNPAMVRDLAGTMDHQKADMAVLVTMQPPTPGMIDAANQSGTYQLARTLSRYPKVQILTAPELLAGKRPSMPPVYLPYIQAKIKPDSEAVAML
jgi:DNA modification methylase